MQTPIQRFCGIATSVEKGVYNDLGVVEIDDESNLQVIKLKVIPHEGVHQGIEYTVTCKFQEGENWPLVFIDSEIYDRVKTSRYILNQGHLGEHKGICIKNLSYGYAFNKHFKTICGNQWKNYIYALIVFFNNIQDFEKGNGLKKNYKSILEI
jgi:hypothetical protein